MRLRNWRLASDIFSLCPAIQIAFFRQVLYIPLPRRSAKRHPIPKTTHSLRTRRQLLDSGEDWTGLSMAHSRNSSMAESDIESSIGRDSSELGETDAFLDQKLPFVSVHEVSKFQSEECPLCLRRARWRAALSFLRLKGKQPAIQCPHDKIIVQEYLRKSRTSPKARLRRRRCRLVATFILVVFAIL